MTATAILRIKKLLVLRRSLHRAYRGGNAAERELGMTMIGKTLRRGAPRKPSRQSSQRIFRRWQNATVLPDGSNGFAADANSIVPAGLSYCAWGCFRDF
jgi:hypothetical protein